jgi:hypothetical protein
MELVGIDSTLIAEDDLKLTGNQRFSRVCLDTALALKACGLYAL